MLCCLAIPLLELPKDHGLAVRAFALLCLLPVEDVSFSQSLVRHSSDSGGWVLFSSGIFSPHPSKSANTEALTYLLPEDSSLES